MRYLSPLLLLMLGCGGIAAQSGYGYVLAVTAAASADIDDQPELPDSLGKQDVGVSGNANSFAPVSGKPLVQMFVTDGCPPCVVAKKYFAGSKIPHVIMPKPNPKWCDEAGRGYPAFAWQTADGTWHYYFGFSTGAEFERVYYGSLK